MLFLVATNVVASRPPERRPTGTPHARANIVPYTEFRNKSTQLNHRFLMNAWNYGWCFVQTYQIILSLQSSFHNCLQNRLFGQKLSLGILTCLMPPAPQKNHSVHISCNHFAAYPPPWGRDRFHQVSLTSQPPLTWLRNMCTVPILK